MDLTIVALGGTIVALVIGCFLLDAIFVSSSEAGEPVHVRPRLPLIGHAIGILQDGPNYFSRIGATVPSGIFTLPIFRFKVYVITDRALITPVQRAARSISFTPFIRKATKACAQLSEKSLELQEEPGFSNEFKNAAVKGMSPGADLDSLNLTTVQEQMRHIDNLAAQAVSSHGNSIYIDLVAWIQHTISQSATLGLYGPMNPFKNPEHEKGFW
jgi:hypothetical protein